MGNSDRSIDDDKSGRGSNEFLRKMKGHEFMAELIRQSGTKAIFFVPTFLYPTLVELAEDPIKRVLCHSEKAAGYMADGYSQASGTPGIVITMGGPGAANLYAGLVDAWQSNTPLLALTPVAPGSSYNGNSYQEAYVDFRPVTKYDAEVRTIDRMAEFFGKAYREMTTGAPRPVHLYLDGALEAEESEFDFRYMDRRYFSYPAFRPQADDGLVGQAVQEIRNAERPVMVCGRGTIVSGAWGEVTTLAEQLSIPVTTTLGGKGSIDDRHPLSLGVTGSYRRPSTDQVLEDADLVLYVGGHNGGATSKTRQLPKPGVRLIHIDINPAQPGANYPNVLPLIGDARSVLRQMLRVVRAEGSATHSAWVAKTKKLLQEWREKEEQHIHGNAIPIRPEQLANEVVMACPENTLYVTDTGFAGTWAGVFMELPAGKNCLHCEGSLGWSFPAAIGAKTAVNERPVVAFTGDGGFFYHLTELETAVRNEINVVTVVLNNQAMALQTHVLRDIWPDSCDLDKLSEFGEETNFAAIAQGMGAWGVRVTDPKEIGNAIRDAIDANMPAVVEVMIDPAAIAPVAFMAKLAES
ncbi:MAG: thiamine pyrophosphate-binding protein [Gammaproteobacteria bacterium]|nr:thiamine pyrophosphate-binding protein [Gammaproteobacteria bacterium]